MSKGGMRFPRMSTWIKKYGPFHEVEREALADVPVDMILSICSSDDTGTSYGDIGMRYVNVEKYLVSSKPMPMDDININVVGISQAGF